MSEGEFMASVISGSVAERKMLAESAMDEGRVSGLDLLAKSSISLSASCCGFG